MCQQLVIYSGFSFLRGTAGCPNGFKMPPVNKPSASSIPGENSFLKCMVTSGLIQMFMQLHKKKKNKETLTGPEFSSQD